MHTEKQSNKTSINISTNNKTIYCSFIKIFLFHYTLYISCTSLMHTDNAQHTQYTLYNVYPAHCTSRKIYTKQSVHHVHSA